MAKYTEYNLKYREKGLKNDPFRFLYYNTKGSSKRHNREFKISKDFLLELYAKQKGKCYYTNRILKTEFGLQDSFSVDRKDPSIGYLPENTVLCCWQVNRMKSNATIEELIQFAKDILLTLK